eukprot:4116471-Alexandrium_andersonii.AAC.1
MAEPHLPAHPWRRSGETAPSASDPLGDHRRGWAKVPARAGAGRPSRRGASGCTGGSSAEGLQRFQQVPAGSSSFEPFRA